MIIKMRKPKNPESPRDRLYRSGPIYDPHQKPPPQTPKTVELIHAVRDAVVTVTSGSLANPDHRPTGNGVIIKNNLILCPACLIIPLIDRAFLAVAITNQTTVNYPALVVGYDKAANFACLRLVDSSIILTAAPMGASRTTSVGSACYIIGNLTAPDHDRNTSVNSIAQLTLGDNRYLDYGNRTYSAVGELLLLHPMIDGGLGAPIFNQAGQIIGLYLGQGVALAEHFFKIIASSIINNYLKNLADKKELVESSFFKSYLGIWARPVTHRDIAPYPGLLVEGYWVTDNWNGLQINDILHRIELDDGKLETLGDGKDQQSPAMVMWKLKIGISLKLHYRRLVDGVWQSLVLETVTTRYPEWCDQPLLKQRPAL